MPKFNSFLRIVLVLLAALAFHPDFAWATCNLSVGNTTSVTGPSAAQSATFPVTLSQASSSTVTVNYATADGTAVAGTDYTAASGTLTIPAGTVASSFGNHVTSGTSDASGLTFTATVSNATNATITNATGTCTITRDTHPDVVSVSPSAQTTQTNQPALITTTYSTAFGLSSLTAASVNFGNLSSAGTSLYAKYQCSTGLLYLANPSGIYIGGYAPGSNNVITTSLGALNCAQTTVSESGTQLIVGWDVTPTASLVGNNSVYPIISDTYGATSGWLNSGSWRVTPPTLSIGNAAVLTGPAGSQNATFTVALSTAQAAAVTANYATANGTATAGTDYTAASGTLTIPAGNTTGTITVAAAGGQTDASGLTFTVTLSSPVGATLATATGTATITHDPGPVLVGVSPNPALSPVNAAQTLTATYSWIGGGANLATASILAGASLTAGTQLSAKYVASSGLVYETDAAGDSVGPGYAPGSANTIATSSGSLNLAGTTVSVIGNQLIIAWSFTPATTMLGVQNVYLDSVDGLTVDSTWQQIGVWTIAAPPVANSASLTVLNGTPLTIALSATDPNGYALTYTIPVNPSHGTLSTPGASIVYTPTGTYTGSDSFTFEVTDTANLTATAVISLNVLPAPTAAPQSYTMNEGGVLTVAAPGVLTGAKGNGLTLTANLPATSAHGLIAPSGNGGFTYTPVSTFFGTDSFNYTVTDANNVVSAPATVTIVVNEPAPYAYSYAVEVPAGQPSTIYLGGYDYNGQPLTISELSNPAHGGLSGLTADEVQYTPTGTYSGADSFTYEVYDGTDYSAPATISIAVKPSLVAPNSSYSCYENGGVSINLLPDGDDPETTTVTVGAGLPGLNFLERNGSYCYSPPAGFIGTVTFTYTLTDQYGGVSNSATVTIQVNPLPVAQSESVFVYENTPTSITLNFTYLNGDTGILCSTPLHGTLSFTPNTDVYTYTPATGYTGSDSFNFSSYPSNVATISINVLSGPEASNESYELTQGGTLTVPAPGPLADANDEALPLTMHVVSTTTHGTLNPNLDGSFTYSTANVSGWFGQDSFTYTVTDNSGQVSPPATVTLIVDAVPVAYELDTVAWENQTLVCNDLLPGSVSVDWTKTVIFSEVGGAGHGNAIVDANGDFTYTPDPNYSGEDSFTYQVQDGSRTSNVASVDIFVVTTPVCLNQSYSVPENQTLTVLASGLLQGTTESNYTAGFTLCSIDGGGLSANTAEGSLYANSDGSFSFQPAPNFVGAATFTYQAVDQTNFPLESGPATITINVIGPPVASNLQYTAYSGNPLSVTLSATDPAGNAITSYQAVTEPTNGTLTGTGPGGAIIGTGANLIYTPSFTFVGTDSFTYTAADSTGAVSAPATVTITVLTSLGPPTINIIGPDTVTVTAPPAMPYGSLSLQLQMEPQGQGITQFTDVADGQAPTDVVTVDALTPAVTYLFQYVAIIPGGNQIGPSASVVLQGQTYNWRAVGSSGTPVTFSAPSVGAGIRFPAAAPSGQVLRVLPGVQMSLSAYKAVDWDELDTTGAPNSSTVPTAMSDIVDYSWSVRDFNNNPVGTFPNGCKGPDAVWQAPQPAQGSCGQYFINLTVTDQKNANAGNGSTGSRADSVISFSRYIEVGSADYCH